LEIFWKCPVFSNSHGNKFGNNFLFLGQKFGKVWKKFGNRGFQTFGIYRKFEIYGKFRICFIPNFPKITKK